MARYPYKNNLHTRKDGKEDLDPQDEWGISGCVGVEGGKGIHAYEVGRGMAGKQC